MKINLRDKTVPINGTLLKEAFDEAAANVFANGSYKTTIDLGQINHNGRSAILSIVLDTDHELLNTVPAAQVSDTSKAE